MKQLLFVIFILLTSCQKSQSDLIPENAVFDRTTYTISGKIVWEHDGVTGVQNVTVDLTGAEVQSTTTDVNGNYSFSINTVGNYTVKPVKNINKTNGLTSVDVTTIQQHITFINLLPAPYKRIAADANKSNSISTFDATLINQLLLGNPQANTIFNTSWRFVPTAYTFPNPNVPWGFPEQITLINVNSDQLNQDFIGVKLGDVNGTANPAN